MTLPRLRLAMRIGSEYRVTAINRRHRDAFADQNGLDAARIRQRIDDLASRLPAAFREVAASGPVAALGSELPGRLAGAIEEHVKWCRSALE